MLQERYLVYCGEWQAGHLAAPAKGEMQPLNLSRLPGKDCIQPTTEIKAG